MKKMLGILLCVCLAFCFVGCGEKEETKEPTGVDLEYYSKYGQIPECEFALGKNVDELITEFESRLEDQEAEDGEETHDHDGFFYSQMEYDDRISLHTGNVEYIYKDENKEEGISCIVSYVDAYEIAHGSVISQVEESFAEFEVSRKDNVSEEIFFMAGGEFSCLKYSFEKNDIVFVFADNALCATAIYNNTQWEI